MLRFPAVTVPRTILRCSRVRSWHTLRTLLRQRRSIPCRQFRKAVRAFVSQTPTRLLTPFRDFFCLKQDIPTLQAGILRSCLTRGLHTQSRSSSLALQEQVDSLTV